MLPKLTKITEFKENCSSAVIVDTLDQFSSASFSASETGYLKEKLEKETTCRVYKYPHLFFFYKPMEEPDHQQAESARKAGAEFFEAVKKEKIFRVQVGTFSKKNLWHPFLEGFLLSLYSFSKYKKEKDPVFPRELFVKVPPDAGDQVEELMVLVEAVFHARDLINEPLSYLTAVKFSEAMETMGAEADFRVEVFNKKRIEALRMGGLLAVNRGSPDPPTFTVLEWKPPRPKNEKPVVLVGKGVVFDTGGLSLKPTAKSMDLMKSDMGGGAVVAATLFALAKNRCPLHVIGLVPATDNRPDGNAYVPGDVVTMYDGTTVEIKNTDAEGRLLLADALSYAKKLEPSLVIDVATLTGSAALITGPHALVAMGNTPENMQKMKASGDAVFERIVEVPLWEDFAKPLKSSVADLNNLGSREAQASVAGKFLEHFTGYPWMHLDIAGVAFLQEKDAYRPAGGTGFGTRLLYHFLKKFN